MAELHRIEQVVRRVRRRLRQQAAVAVATTAAIPAVAGALCVWWLYRMELLSAPHARLALLGLGAAVLVAGLCAMLRRWPTPVVATRIDRASGLADRLGTAVDFHRRLGDPELHPDTVALMRHAILDGVAAVPRADVEASAPWRLPPDGKALLVFGLVGTAICALAFGPTRPPAPPRPAVVQAPGDVPPPDLLDPDDLDAQRDFVEDMKQLARDTEDDSLRDMARELDDLLAKAQRGELGKQELLAKMEDIEKRYSAGSAKDMDSLLGDLKEQAKELKKQPVTKKLGDALEEGDMEQAQKELEKLADKVEKGELKPEEKQKLADALAKAAEKQEQQEQKRDREEQKQQEKKIDAQKENIRRLEKKVAENPKDEEQKRTLQKERRELDRLEREKQEQQDQKQGRQLERLTRDLKRSAENLEQKNDQQSAKDLRQGAQDTQRVQQEMKKMANRKKVQSQLSDLKEAIRRAKPQKGGNQGSRQARSQRLRDYQQRAGGGKGNSQAWKPGGQQPGGQQPGSKEGALAEGQDKQSQQWGDQHDPNVQGDPTKLDAKLRDEHLSGVQGEGPSRRETILTSAKKGFAHAAYRKVYADYKKIVEEVMTQEKVPQGYKYYVKRYFQRIKPHSMD